ncbi:MAG: GNAT family protein [Vicinamibacterales bacterium]
MTMHAECFRREPDAAVCVVDWRRRLPTLVGNRVTLREVDAADASALLASLGTEAVSRHLSRPPSSSEGFQRFIAWAQAERRQGTHACFAVVPAGEPAPVGIVQVWRIESDFFTAEWGIAIGDAWWGRGIGHDAAHLLLRFAIDTLGTRRLEARAGTHNERGRQLMLRLGAAHEGTLRRSLRCNGHVRDQDLWAIVVDDDEREGRWAQARGAAAEY